MGRSRKKPINQPCKKEEVLCECGHKEVMHGNISGRCYGWKMNNNCRCELFKKDLFRFYVKSAVSKSSLSEEVSESKKNLPTFGAIDCEKESNGF